MPPAVEVNGLSKVYRTTFSVRRNVKISTGRDAPREHVALRDLSFKVDPGEVYGVLGPNGAGKTTLMKVIATILLPERGGLRIFGTDAVKHPEAVRPRIGVVLGEYERTFHWRLTGMQNLLFFADFFNMPRQHARRRAQEVLEMVGLEHKGGQLFLEYSTGEKHRLALARGMLNEPDLLVLDEPTAGLDAHSSQRIGKLAREAARRGVAVCYTTHRLLEAGKLCDRILIIDGGQKVAEASPDDLVGMAKRHLAVDVAIEGGSEELVALLGDVDGVHEAVLQGGMLRLLVDDVHGPVEEALGVIRSKDAKVRAINTHTPTVEDVFMELTGGTR